MLNEKKEILCRIHNKINRRKSEMLSRFSRINKLTDDFIFRMFNTLIEYNDGDDKIRYKKINNNSDTNDIILLFYIPKGTYFEKLKKEYVNTIICLSGCVEIEFNGNLIYVDSDTRKKIDIITNEFNCRALENTYLITLSNPK